VRAIPPLCIRDIRSTTLPAVLLAPFRVVEQKEDGNSYRGIDRGSKKLMNPKDMEVGVAEQAAIDKEDEKAVEQEEAEVDEDTSGEVLNVNLDADAGGDVSNDRLCHPIDADGLVGECILQEADGGSGQGAGDWIAPGDGEEDGNNERKIENCEPGKRLWKQDLKQDCAQRNQQSDRWMEAVLLKLSPGCVAAGGHKTVVSCPFSNCSSDSRLWW
jgi:hypothetical protein